MKRVNNRAVLLTVLATGISSVVAQLITIREFLADFEGNEFVVCLILLCWLVPSGIGALLADLIRRRAGQARAKSLGMITACIAVMPTLQILAVRYLRDTMFVQGSSVGFYPTLAFAGCAVSPYALLIGFALPYSLFVLRSGVQTYPASRIYALDSIGAALGGAAFSFVLVYLLTPFKALFVVNALLLFAFCLLLAAVGMRMVIIVGLAFLVTTVNLTGAVLELATLKPKSGELITYQESFFGRITLIKDKELLTLFLDGVPVQSSQNQITAEEAVHYALAQLSSTRRILVISMEAGIMDEIEKYRPEGIDFAELDYQLSVIEFKYQLIKKQPGLRVITDDARAYLKRTLQTYDAILVNYPEPKTFQTNRYFTREFMRLARARLNPGGVLSFSVEGYESYLSGPERLRVSSLYNTAQEVFPHVLILPGQKIWFIAGDKHLRSDIPLLLSCKGIRTEYIKNYYYGDISQERVASLTRLIDSKVPINTDLKPFLMRLAYESWFAKYSSRPLKFFIALAAFFVFYILRLHREEFVLFTAGFMNMGSEILTIFLFQILFGYLYVKIGLIVTVYLAGLIPGVLFGQHLKGNTRQILILTDLLMVSLICLVAGLLILSPQRLPEGFFYTFSFLVSVLCGIEFPLVALCRGGGDTVAARAFSVDLVGAALASVLLSAFIIPFFGIIASCMILIAFKLGSIIVLIRNGTDHQEDILTLQHGHAHRRVRR